MRPELKPPGKTSDGWTVLLREEHGQGQILAGTGATAADAFKAAYRETAVIAGILAHSIIVESRGDTVEALTRLHQVASLFLAGAASLEALAECCAAVESVKRVQSK